MTSAIQQLERRLSEAERRLKNLPVRFAIGGGSLDNLYRLKKVSGSAGGGTGNTLSFCSFAYDVYDKTDSALASPLYTNVAVTGNFSRRSPVEMNPANWGYGDLVAGTFMLFDVDESEQAWIICDSDTPISSSSSGSS